MEGHTTHHSFRCLFSNALIIHQIITAKEVWIPFSYLSVYSLVFVSIEKISQTFDTVIHRPSKHLELRCATYVFGYPDETLSLVFDISPIKRMQISLCSHFHQTIQFSFKLF